MEENNKIESLNDIELTNKKENNAKFCKIQRNHIIIIGCLILIYILLLSYFILIDVKVPKEFKRSNDSPNLENTKILEEKALNICEIGEEEKCLECNSSKNQCLKCNLGYKLIDGKCIINYSIKATYFCNSDNKTIILINSSYINDIIEISLNNKSIPVSPNYTIPYKGNYTFYFLMKNPSSNSLSQMFRQIKNLTSIFFSSKYNTENVTDIRSMFEYCTSLASINLSNFNTKNVINMNMLFFKCEELKSIDLSRLKTQNLKDMSEMFSYATSLTSIDFTNFDTSNVLNMSYLFESCYSLTSINISNFNTQKVEDMSNMFYGDEIEKLDLSNFNTKNVKYMN